MSANPKKKVAIQKMPVVVFYGHKKEAAKHVSNNIEHIHSSTLLELDPCYKITSTHYQNPSLCIYPWETASNLKALRITSSGQRPSIIEEVLEQLANNGKNSKQFAEKIQSVLEELITNAIYHSFKLGSQEKYQRASKVTLQSQETVQVEYSHESTGIYLSVIDSGGKIDFSDFQKSFERCYQQQNQIENKQGGAGLGLYMIFEIASHIKAEVVPGKWSRISCWISDNKSFDPKNFSFNFFRRKS